MNLPNALTLLRIFFVPVLIVVLLTRSPNVDVWGLSVHFEVWGVLILLAAAATDAADGPGNAAVLRARANILVLTEALAKHGAYFDAGARP